MSRLKGKHCRFYKFLYGWRLFKNSGTTFAVKFWNMILSNVVGLTLRGTRLSPFEKIQNKKIKNIFSKNSRTVECANSKENWKILIEVAYSDLLKWKKDSVFNSCFEKIAIRSQIVLPNFPAFWKADSCPKVPLWTFDRLQNQKTCKVGPLWYV